MHRGPLDPLGDAQRARERVEPAVDPRQSDVPRREPDRRVHRLDLPVPGVGQGRRLGDLEHDVAEWGVRALADRSVSPVRRVALRRDREPVVTGGHRRDERAERVGPATHDRAPHGVAHRELGAAHRLVDGVEHAAADESRTGRHAHPREGTCSLSPVRTVSQPAADHVRDTPVKLDTTINEDAFDHRCGIRGNTGPHRGNARDCYRPYRDA